MANLSSPSSSSLLSICLISFQDHRLLTPSPHLDNNSDSGCSVATDSGRGSHAESTGGGDVIITSSLPNDRLDETGKL